MSQPVLDATSNQCFMCRSRTLQQIPAIWDFSMTTAGVRVAEPLSKFQCMTCGLLQRAEIRHLGSTDFYENHYSFYERPGAGIYDQPRYRAMAEWIKDAIPERYPSTILDAGCGRGWMLEAMKGVYPQALLMGIEPSSQESKNARERGFNVLECKVSSDEKIDRKFDLIYSTNVVEHTSDPANFLGTLNEWLEEEGCIVITCPDSSVPSSEFMFSDQNFSFTPKQLVTVAQSCGLHLLKWQGPPAIDSVQNKQLLVFVKGKTNEPQLPVEPSPAELFQLRKAYVQAYSACDDFLLKQVSKYENVYNFGTSTFSWLLSCYCPKYWQRVTHCVIDKPEAGSSFQNKPVIDRSAMSLTSSSVICLGVNPKSQANLQQNLSSLGIEIIRWDHMISC